MRLAPLALVIAVLLRPALAWADAALPDPLAARVEAARNAALPAAALEAKAREGLAKGVRIDRIAAVLDTMAVNLADAASILGAGAEGPDRDALLVAAVVARAAGLSDGSVRLLARERAGVRARALHAAADLCGLGFGEADATGLVRAAASSEDPLAALSDLATSASLLVAAGVPPSTAIGQLADDAAGGRQSRPNVPPQSRSGLPDPAQDTPGKGARSQTD
jgi:hypothetical protein